MKSLCLLVFVAVLVSRVISQEEDPYDDTHECQLFRQCKDCFAVEYCVKFWWSIQRWWMACPFWARYCNPYSQRCEANPIAECAKLLPTTTAKATSTVSTTTVATTTAGQSTTL